MRRPFALVLAPLLATPAPAIGMGGPDRAAAEANLARLRELRGDRGAARELAGALAGS